MDKQLFQQHAELCRTLANPVRLEILSLLREGERQVNELVEASGLNQANVSQHLSILRSRGLIAARREGTHVCYRIAHPKIIRACDLIREVLIEQATEHAELVGAQTTDRSRS